MLEPVADALAVAAQDLVLPFAALRLQVGIEGIPTLEPGQRRHEVPPGVANHPLHIAFIVTLARTAVAVFEKVMGHQPGEGSGPLPCPVRQNARHKALVIVIQDRLRHAAKKGKGPVVAVQPSFRRRRRVGRDEAGIALGKGHDEKMHPKLDPGDDRIRLAEVRLGMAGRMRQGHEHLPLTTAAEADIVLHDGLLAHEAMLIAKTFEDPLRRVALLAVDRAVRFQNIVNDSGEGIKLWPLDWLATAVARWLHMPQHLPYRRSCNAKPTCRLSLAQSVNMTGQPNTQIKLHGIHLPPSIPKGSKVTGGKVLSRPQLGKSRCYHGPICHRRSQT